MPANGPCRESPVRCGRRRRQHSPTVGGRSCPARRRRRCPVPWPSGCRQAGTGCWFSLRNYNVWNGFRSNPTSPDQGCDGGNVRGHHRSPNRHRSRRGCASTRIRRRNRRHADGRRDPGSCGRRHCDRGLRALLLPIGPGRGRRTDRLVVTVARHTPSGSRTQWRSPTRRRPRGSRSSSGRTAGAPPWCGLARNACSVDAAARSPGIDQPQYLCLRRSTPHDAENP